MAMDKFFGGFVSAVQIDRAKKGLEQVGQVREFLASSRFFLALVQDEKFAKVQIIANFP